MRDHDSHRNSDSAAERQESAGLDLRTRALHRRMLQRKAERAGAAPDAGAAVERAEQSSGQALPGPLKQRFERSLGTDLGDVRVHTGTDSAAASEAVGAKAYATGSRIHFAAGQYDPGSRKGQELLAHEVVHTVQQRSGSLGPQLKGDDTQGQCTDPNETDADDKACQMVNEAGLPQVETATGKLIHPLRASDAPGMAVAGFNHATTELMDAQKGVDATFVDVNHRVADSSDPIMEESARLRNLDPKELKTEIEGNLTDQGANQAKDMNNAGARVEDITHAFEDASQSLGHARKTLHNSETRARAAHDKRHIQELQKKIDEVDHWSKLILEGSKKVGEAVLDPEKAAEIALDYIGDKLNEFCEDKATADLKKEKEETEESVLEDEEEAADGDVELAEDEIGDAKTTMGKLQTSLQGATATQEARRETAEEVYDQNTGGDFSFGEVEQQIEKTEAIIDRARSGEEDAERLERYIDEVAGGVQILEEMTQLGEAPEIDEEKRTLEATRERAEKEREFLNTKRFEFEREKNAAEAKRGQADEALGSAAEHHHYQPDAKKKK